MKVLLDFGVAKVVEDLGVYSVEVDGSAALGGGKAAGVLSASGQGKLSLDRKQAMQLGWALLNNELPKSWAPEEAVVEDLAEKAIEAVE